MWCRAKTTSLESMEFNRDYYYDIARKLLSVVGQWPYQPPKQKLFSLVIFTVIAVSLLIPQMALLFYVCDNATCFVESLSTYMLIVMTVVKTFGYQFNRRNIKNLTDHLFVDWNTLQTEEEYKILKKYAQTGRWYTLVYASYIYIGLLLFVTPSLVSPILDVVFPLNTSRPKILICGVYYFVDEDEYFYYIFLHTLIAAEICLTGLIAHDCMFFIYIEHVCGLFAVVGFRFEYWLYRYNNEEKSSINCSDDMYCKNVAFSVIAHREALRFAALLEKTFSISFAVQMLIVTFGMSITLVELSMRHQGDILDTLKYVVFILNQLFHLFCLNYEGQKLIDHSLETHDKIYNGSWYKIPVKTQKLLLFGMKKSAEASFLSAGKIFIFCRQSFTTVLQTSMSYFTVLSSVNE